MLAVGSAREKEMLSICCFVTPVIVVITCTVSNHLSKRSLKVSGFVRTAVPRKRDAVKEEKGLQGRRSSERRVKKNLKKRREKAKRKIAMKIMKLRVNQTAKKMILSKVKVA